MKNTTEEELLKMFSDMLSQSEKRIDRTNEMIDHLASTVECHVQIISKITSEYTQQLDRMQECRDNALVELQKITELLIKKDETINLLLGIIKDKNSTNINVH